MTLDKRSLVVAPRYTLSREQRIRARRDFLRIQESGQKLFSKHFVIAICLRQERFQKDCVGNDNSKKNCALETCSRVGITVTKKVDKRAVARNRLKRRIKELFRQQQYYSIRGNNRRPSVKSPIDLVVIARQRACELSYEEIKKEICYAMKRAKF